MRAILHDGYGAPDVLAFGEIDVPAPAAGEALLAVRAASVNAADWHVLRGDPYLARLAFGVRKPRRRVLGRDVAGRVQAVGSGVTRLRPGDEVYGDLGTAQGAFAEYVSVPEQLLESKPPSLTFEQAAAVPLAGNTALMAVRDLGQVQPGQRVLVNGASGGVGTFAVQLAAASGAEVTAVCSPQNADAVRSLGAADVVDYTREDVTRTGQRYDVVLDLVGNRSLRALRRVLAPTGTLVLSGGGVSRGGSFVGPLGLIAAGALLAPLVRQRVLRLDAQPRRENLAALCELIESGWLMPVIDRSFPLDEVAEAIRYVESGHPRAKVVIVV